MDELDLGNDDPEDYPGKLVRIDGALYRIGEYVGSGAERIVHHLANVESGLTLHLIKILRVQDQALQTAIRNRDRLDTARRWGLPTAEDPQIVQAHGGVFEVDEAATEEAGETGAAMERARKLWEPQPSDALDILAGLIAANGSHTEALHCMARIYAALGDVNRALELEAKVLAIEPNIRPYKFMFMEWAGCIGLLNGLLSEFHNLQLKWPNDHRADELAVLAYLALGQPERSLEVIDRSVPEVSTMRMCAETLLSLVHLPRVSQWQTLARPWRLSGGSQRTIPRRELSKGRLRSELGPKVKSALRAKRKAMRSMNAALAAFQAHDGKSSLRALEQAHSVYPEYPFVRANFGLAKFRAGDWDQAVDALVLAAQAVPSEWRSQCFASAAFAAIMGEHYDMASDLLKAVLSDLQDEAGGQQIQPADVPGLAMWMDDRAVLAERSDSPVRLLERVVRHFQSKGEVPLHLQTLVVLFREASAMISGS
jgi:tetratricopeptide (TPR) repeat protein